MIAPNSTDRQWYLNRISGKSCKVVQSNENLTPEFQESPKPFNPGCYTIPELITVILTLIGRAELRSGSNKQKWTQMNHISYMI